MDTLCKHRRLAKLTVRCNDAWITVEDIMGGTGSCDVVDVEFSSLSGFPAVSNTAGHRSRGATYTIANPVVREREYNLDSIFSSCFDHVVKPLQTLRCVVQSPGPIIPNLIEGQAGLKDITQLGCIDGVESLGDNETRDRGARKGAYPSPQDLYPSTLHFPESRVYIILAS